MKKIGCLVGAVVLLTAAGVIRAQEATAKCGPGSACAVSKAKAQCGSCKAGSECTKLAGKVCERKCKDCKCGKEGGKCGGGAQAKAAEASATLTVEALDAIINSGTTVVVLDARSGKWDDGRRIPGAKSLNHKATAEQAAKLIPSKDQLVVTYCSNTKCQASAKLAGKLHELGYKNVVELPVGIAGWTEAGKTVEKAK